MNQAEKIADFMLNHPLLAEDKIPYWDMSDPALPTTERDASAAAVLASGLVEFAGYTKNVKYLNAAQKILESLASNSYRAEVDTNNGFILKHSTGNKPAGSEIDVPIIYADYYFIEALMRWKAL